MHARSIFISGERIFPFHRRIIQSNYSRIYSNRDIEKYFRNRHVSPLCMQNSSDYHSFVKRERDRKKGEEEKDTDAINKLLTLFRSTFLFSLYFYLSISPSVSLHFIIRIIGSGTAIAPVISGLSTVTQLSVRQCHP